MNVCKMPVVHPVENRFPLWKAPVRDTIEQCAGKASMHPKSEGFLESSLYVNDVTGSASVLREDFRLSPYQRFRRTRLCNASRQSANLVAFRKGGCVRTEGKVSAQGLVRVHL